MGMAILSLLLPFSKKGWLLNPLKRYSSAYIAFVILFFYLSLTAYRNIPFSVLIMIPALYSGAGRFLKKIHLKNF
jgi:hypothetical protein